MGQVVPCCKNYKFVLLLAVLDAFIAVSEDLNLKFSRESKPLDPLVCSRLRVRLQLENSLRGPW